MCFFIHFYFLFLLGHFFILELIGNAYLITTGDIDFDYSLIAHSLLNIKSVVPVFLGAISFSNYIISGGIFVIFILIVMKIILSYCKKENAVSSNQVYKNIVGISVSLLLLFSINLTLNFSKKTRINKVPLPISLISLSRSIRNGLLYYNGKTTSPIRDQFALDAKL